jgi:uncharacterized protein
MRLRHVNALRALLATALFSPATDAGAASAERSGLRGGLVLEGDAPLGQHERRSTLAPLNAKRFDALRKSCERHDFAACASVGRYYNEGVSTPVDVGHASELFRAACTHGQQRGCVYWALQSVRAGDDKKAFTLLLDACDKRDPLGCLELGLQYLTDVAAPRDEAHAFELVERSCKARYQEGCATLALFYDLGLGVAKSEARSLALSDAACIARVPMGCTNAGYAYEIGRGTAPDFAKAVLAYQNGCGLGSQFSCVNLGRTYLTGHGMPKDPSLAQPLFKVACDAGNVEGCHSLGRWLLDVKQDFAGATILLQQSCDQGSIGACQDYGYALEQPSNPGKDPAHALALYVHAALLTQWLAPWGDGGDGSGKNMLGQLLMDLRAVLRG